MSFTTDMRTDEVNKRIKFFPDRMEFVNGHGEMIRAINITQWNYWVDGLPVDKPLMLLAQRIRAKMPKAKFGAPNDYKSRVVGYGSVVPVFEELIVYREEDDFALGLIGYKEYVQKDPTKKLYGIASPKINKRNVSRHNEMRYFALTEKLDKAETLACSYLTPRPAAALAELTFRSFHDEVSDASRTITQDARKFVDSCSNSSVLVVELRNLIRQNVAFVTAEFRVAAEKFLEADALAQKVKTQRVGAYYVYLQPGIEGKMMASVCTFDQDVKRGPSMDPPSQTARMYDHELPEDVQHKIALLSMMDIGTYVPEVGTRAAARSFWIERVLQ